MSSGPEIFFLDWRLFFSLYWKADSCSQFCSLFTQGPLKQLENIIPCLAHRHIYLIYDFGSLNFKCQVSHGAF